MNYAVVIPAHNEQDFLGLTLQSLVTQTVIPSQVLIVNDNSLDDTSKIAVEFSQKYSFISVLNLQSSAEHVPGSKVIHAFNAGYAQLIVDADIIVKLDADLQLPPNYFEVIIKTFQSDDHIGMVGGFAYIEKNSQWILENLTDKDHIRGAFKSYRKECFKQIGGLKPAMGWDTVDELLARYYGWKILTIGHLHVKHLKPTGIKYNATARFKQGEAFYSLGYGWLITIIASAKLALLKKQPKLFFDYISGFRKAKAENKPLLVTSQQAKFIRNFRIQRMKSKLF